ncbi:OsmC family protein [Amycolatopsis suaedae]|uniref:OsmC family peroxiredoxin n=1 Tax=Amycolatopsis suaedae TaxID=2510978 RepID=A0A4Q7JEJ7_9PSEU|nr:OsmC family protein [Amycolatopsis suaedae]RZQ65929.1 OsmC family peroxiredoxin [Amycolatopsis suaedae]
MSTVSVTHLADQKFRVETRDHVVLVDQPADDGTEVGPTPLELLVMALASCAAHYGVAQLRADGLPADGLMVQARWTTRPDPVRVGRVSLRIVLPAPLEPAQQQRLLAAIDHCAVHNTLRCPPQVEIEVAEPSMLAIGR